MTKFTTARLLTAIVFIAIFTMAVRLPADTDTWWHLKAGQYIVERHTIPTTDPFSHTRGGTAWIDHGWLAQIFWYGLFALGGWVGLSFGLAALVTATFALMWRVTPGNLYIRAFALILGAITSAVIWVARPQMVSFLLAGVVLFLLERYKQTGRHTSIYALPLVMLLWANIHGGYAIAFMLIAAYVVGEAFNRVTGHNESPVLSWRQIGLLVGMAMVSFGAVVVNPHGWQMWVYPFRTVGISALRDFIQEWQSPDFHLSMTWPFVGMLALTLTAIGRSSRRADWTDLALVGMWLVWSLFAARNIGLYGLLTIPVLARHADSAWGHLLPSGERRGLPRLNGALLALIIVAALVKIGAVVNPQAMDKAERESLPAAAVAFIQAEQPPGPIFNSYNWGGYLIFKLWPDYPVYVDGRTDLYDDPFLRRYLETISAGGNWRQNLADDGINLVVVESDSTLAKFLRDEPGWTEIYHDEMAAIFRREK